MDLPVRNQRAFLVLPRAADARHATRIEDVLGKVVQVAVPTQTDLRQALAPGERVQLQFFNADGHVLLLTEVLGHVAGGRSVRLQPVEAERGQRRQFLRWEVDLPIKLRFRDEGAEAPAEEEPGLGASWIRARLLDLGGGGVGIRTGKPLDEEKPLSLQIRLPTGPVQAEGTVVNQRADGASWRVSIRFDRITEAARSRIVRFIFQEELRFRRAMLGDDAP